MSTLSQKEIQRQYRVLRQTLGIHSNLRDEYSCKERAAQIVMLCASVIFCATTFADEHLYEALKLAPSIGRIVLGFASIIAFAASLIVMFVDWRGHSALHAEAAQRWSVVLQLFRKKQLEDGSWSEAEWSELSNAYWDADKNSVKIPDKRFNELKKKYLRKVAVSEFKSRYPACPTCIVCPIFFFRDTTRALKERTFDNGEH